MVMSKAVLDAQRPTELIQPTEVAKQDRWHTKAGKWNAAGTRVREAIMEYLDEVAADVPYSDIKRALIISLPDDCTEMEGEAPDEMLKWTISNTDVKALVATLVVEGKAVDN